MHYPQNLTRGTLYIKLPAVIYAIQSSLLYHVHLSKFSQIHPEAINQLNPFVAQTLIPSHPGQGALTTCTPSVFKTVPSALLSSSLAFGAVNEATSPDINQFKSPGQESRYPRRNVPLLPSMTVSYITSRVLIRLPMDRRNGFATTESLDSPGPELKNPFTQVVKLLV